VRGAARPRSLSARRRLCLLALSTLSVLTAGLSLGGGPALAAARLDPHFSPLAQREASASSAQFAGATFNSDTLISDANFRAVKSMSQAQVQSFLNGQSGILKSYAAADVNSTVRPASQIIWEAAQAFDVSPKVVLVTLQKEQGLLTSPAPSASALAWAMGCGVPDTGSPNTAYKGFGKQVWWGSDSLSVDGRGWHAGITKGCGDGKVSPTNISTYSLYTYTPWIGLAGGGNKLFWTLYWQYFGDPIGDVTAPTTTATGVDSAWHNTAVAVNFAATDNPGGSGVAYTEYALNAGKTWTRANAVTIAAPVDHANDGVHTIAYRSVDDSRNVEATKTCKVRIDTTAPLTQDNAGVAWRDNAVTVTLTASDPKPKASAGITSGSSGVAHSEYSRDGGATWVRGTSLTIAAPADHSSDGPQQIFFRSADKAGNLSGMRSCTVNIDTRKPRPYANWSARVVRGHAATLRYYIADPRPGSPSATAVIKIRTLAGRSLKTLVVRGAVNSSLSAHFVCWLARGSYRFTVSATDAAGNTQAASASNRLTVR